MLSVKRVDHISMAAPAWQPQAEKLEKLLGFKLLHSFGANSASDFDGSVSQVRNTGIEFEVICPSGPESFVQKYLDQTNAALLTAEVKVATDAAIAALQATLAGDNYLAIRAAIEALDHASKPFAEIRMNLAIAKAMAGKRVEEVEEGYAEGHIR